MRNGSTGVLGGMRGGPGRLAPGTGWPFPAQHGLPLPLGTTAQL